MNTTPPNPTQSNPRIYVLHAPAAVRPGRAARCAGRRRAPRPARQPLPMPVLDPNKPRLKLGLDLRQERRPWGVFVSSAGHGFDAANVAHWIVRKLPAP